MQSAHLNVEGTDPPKASRKFVRGYPHPGCFVQRVRRRLIPEELREILSDARVKRVRKQLKGKELTETGFREWSCRSGESSEA